MWSHANKKGSSEIWSDANKNSYNLSNNKPPTDCTDITEVDTVSVSRQDISDFRQASPTLFHGLNDVYKTQHSCSGKRQSRAQPVLAMIISCRQLYIQNSKFKTQNSKLKIQKLCSAPRRGNSPQPRASPWV